MPLPDIAPAVEGVFPSSYLTPSCCCRATPSPRACYRF